MNVPVSRLPVLVVDAPLEQRCADAVREAAAHLALGEQWVEQPAGVVHRDVVEHVTSPVSRSTSTTADVDDEAVRGGRRDAVVVVRRGEVGRRVVRRLVRARAPCPCGSASGFQCAIPATRRSDSASSPEMVTDRLRPSPPASARRGGPPRRRRPEKRDE